MSVKSNLEKYIDVGDMIQWWYPHGWYVLAIVSLSLALLWTAIKLRRSQKDAAYAASGRLRLVDFIQRFASSISYSRSIEEWMGYVTECLRHMLEVEGVWIFQYNDQNEAQRVMFKGQCPPITEHASRQNLSLLTTLMKERIHFQELSTYQSELFPRRPDDTFFCPDAFVSYGRGPIRSILSVPIYISREVLGTIIVINPASSVHRLFDSNDLFLLQTMAIQVGLGLTFIQIYGELSEKQRIEQEIQLAQEIQRSLLPEDPPIVQGYAIHGTCRPARQVSGDFYDFIWLSPSLLLVVIADASGKGIPACMLAAMVRSMIRMLGPQHRNDLESVMQELNRKIFEDTETWQFLTMGCILLDLSDSTVEYIRAGHTPLIIRYPDGKVVSIRPTGPALGMVLPEKDPSFESFSFFLEPGTVLMMFTDGVNEALSITGEEYGIERLIKKVEEIQGTPKEMVNQIFETVDAFCKGTEQNDDQTIVLIQKLPFSPSINGT